MCEALIIGVWGEANSGGRGAEAAEPLVRGTGGEAPP